MTRFAQAVAVTLVLASPLVATAQQPKTESKKAARASIYDPNADARAQVKAAAALAKRDARRVLVMFGGDWCGWCHKLHGLFKSNDEIRQTLADEYVLVMVDTKAPHAEELLEECQGDLSGVGFPFLAVLDGQGKVVTRQKTDPLEEGDHHDPAKVKAFLQKWTAPKAVASKAVEEGLAKASSEDKLVFLHFGAPTCGWCHKLEAFLAREDMAPIFAREFVDVKVDLDRMTGTQDVYKKYNTGSSAGIPWFVFLDAKGNPLATSDGPKGNIGYPATPEEVAHFMAMLKKAAKRLEPSQVEAVEAALKAEGKKIEAARSRAAR